MKTLVLLAGLMLSSVPSSAAEYTCRMWNLNSEKEKLIFAAGYQAGVNLAVKVAPVILGQSEPSHEQYVAAYRSVVPGGTPRGLAYTISLYCESRPTENVIDAVIKFAAKEKNRPEKKP